MFFPFFQTIPAPIIDGDDESRLIPTFRDGLHRRDRVGAFSCTETESKPRQLERLSESRLPKLLFFFESDQKERALRAGATHDEPYANGLWVQRWRQNRPRPRRNCSLSESRSELPRIVHALGGRDVPSLFRRTTLGLGTRLGTTLRSLPQLTVA